MSRSVKLTKNAVPDKYKCSCYDIGFYLRSEFSLPDGSMGKNVIAFLVDMTSFVHIDKQQKNNSILVKSSTQGLDYTTLTADTQNSINFSRSNVKFSLSVHYNGSNSFLFVNPTKIYVFKGKESKIKNIPCI